MFAAALQSGSNGNSIYVEACGVRLLIDAGIPGRSARNRLAALDVDIREVNAVIISHDHADHVRCAGVYQRMFGLPLYMTTRTHEATAARGLGRLSDVRHFRTGETLDFGTVSVETVPTAHDAADGAAFVVDTGDRRLGVLTDLGHPFEGLGRLISTLDAVIIESNYDPHMLDAGPYPAFLKQRIRGPRGHLSNGEAAGLLASHGRRLRWACLAHLSEQNNHPALALKTHRDALGPDKVLLAASRRESTNRLLV
jgi:phosphoribosyl 1,2-cyclic phosphodiesterase